MIRVGSLGAGYFARFQIAAWTRLKAARVVAVGDTDLAARTAGAAIAPSALAVADLTGVLAERPDLVDIATPPDTHAALIRACLGRVQTVICQKPFCTSLDEAQAVVGEARAAGLQLIVHENFRFQPWYREIARLLNAGALGTVRQARFALRPGDGAGPRAYLDRQPYFRQMPRFLIRETGIHLIDVFRYLLGEPETVYADLWRENPAIAGEDAGLVIFGLPGGARVVFDGNRTLDHAAENPRLTMGEMTVEGTAAEVRLSGGGKLRLRLRGEADWLDHEYAFEDRDFGGDCVTLFQAHVLRGLRGEAEIETLAEDYLRNLELEALVYASAGEGRRLPAGE